MPLGFPPEAIRSASDYRPLADDIFIVSYPKCGTTWLQYIVWLLVRGRPLHPNENLTLRFPHLEEVGAGATADQPRPRLVKTHLPRALTPWSAAVRYLHIARNPFDCAVSFFHHTRGFPRHYDFERGRFEDFFACFLAGEVDFGDYFDHLISWREVGARDNVMFLTYEALKLEPAATIAAVAQFLGGSTGTPPGEPQIAAIIEETSLKSMQRDPQRWSSRRPDSAPAFVRKGVIGDWRSEFSPGQAGALLAKFDQRLGPAGLANLWPGIVAEVRAYAASSS